MSLSPETFQGLNSILEDNRYSIERSCSAVERCLDANRDNLRGFFEQCFSLLLKQTFGYDGSSWLNSIAKGSQDSDAKALVGLFAPGGKLFQAIQAADADSLIKFEFPINRLPTHSQQLMCLESGRKALESWPQYFKHIVTDSRGKHHVHLNVFEYFACWTAFYVLRSSQVSGGYNPQAVPKGYAHLAPSLGSVRKALGVNKDRPHISRHPYLRLLRLYLDQFLPRTSSSGFGPTGLQSPRQRSSDAAQASRGRLFLCVLLEFWLTDGDLPVQLPGNSRDNPDLVAAWKTANTLRVRMFQAPSDDLIEALAVLTRYLTCIESSQNSASRPAQTSPWLPSIPADSSVQQQSRAMAVGRAPSRLGFHASPSAQAFARRLYRFLKRALLLWPEHQPLTHVVDLWLAYTIPWQEENPDLRSWEPHVLSNLPFYTILFPAFLDLLRTRVSSRGDAALSDHIKVMRAWRASPQLGRLLRAVEADLREYEGAAGRRPEGPYADTLPFLASLRQDWEAYAAAGPSAGAQTAEAGSGSLFGSEEGCAAGKARDLLGAAAGAAKAELLSEARGVTQAVLPLSDLPALHAAPIPNPSTPLTPIQGLRRAQWQDVHYKGDWMRRPLSSTEVPWLVRILLHLSDAVNAHFHLDQPLPRDSSSAGVVSWLRKNHWKLNLRPLGEKQLLLWLPICYLFLWLIFAILRAVVKALSSI